MQFFPNLLGKAGGNSFTRTAVPLDEPAGRHLSLVVAAIPANTAFPDSVHQAERAHLQRTIMVDRFPGVA